MASYTGAINRNLGLIAICSIILLLGILLYRICRIVCGVLLTGIMYLPEENEEDTDLKKFAQKGLIGSALRFVTLVLLSVLRLVVVALQVAISIVYALLPLVFVALVFVLMKERWSESMLVVADMMNGQVGETLREVIMMPLTIMDTVGSYVLPAFNLAWFMIMKIPTEMIMWILRGEGLEHLLRALSTARLAASETVIASKSFVLANTPNCKEQQSVWFCSNVTETCGSLDKSTIASTCLHATTRELNLLPAFSKLRQSTAHIIAFVGEACHFLGVLANVTLFPLTDPETWVAMDRLSNAVTFAFVGAPSAAIARCALAGGVQARPSMCTPDFGPSFDRIADFGLHLGNVITHWLDAAYLFLFDHTDLETVCASVSKLSLVLWSDETVQRLFGKNQTVMIRMTTTAFALSDGISVVFVKGIGSQIRKSFAPSLWPLPMNPKNGMARTWLPTGTRELETEGVGLMGCACTDDAAGNARVECQIVGAGGSAWEIPVSWSLDMQTQWLTCQRLRIVVQTIRWPHRRVLASTLNVNGEQPAECLGAQCLGADVAIYAIPVCGAINATKAMACFPETIFTRGVCFPYCMALRLVHEGFQPITMRGAMEWEKGVLMAMRNCVPTQMGAPSAQKDTTVRTTCRSQGQPSVAVQQAVGDEATASNPACVYAYSCTTLVTNKTALQEYDANMPFLNAAYNVNPFASMYAYESDGVHLVLNGQPLAVAGDVHMRVFVRDKANFVDFPTLVGNQLNEFTMEMNSPVGIPVVDSHTVVSANEEHETPGTVFMPVRYVQSVVPYNPAVLTRNRLWYASNPSYNWLEAMAIYCESEGKDVRTQLMDLSSYARIRLWSVLYYDAENCYVAPQTQKHVCRTDVAIATGIERTIPQMKSEDIQQDTSLYDLCSHKTEFNLWVESMEYYDELNVAVAVRRGTLAEMGALIAGKKGGRTVFYFFNASNISQTPRAEDPWLPSEAVEEDTRETSLRTCAAFKVLPDVGSVVGHAIAALAYLMKTPVNLVLNPFGLMEVLQSRSSQTCPENGLQHSVLANCGMELLSLDAFFEEVYATNSAVWNVGYWLLSTLLPGNSINDNNNKESQMFRSFLQGGLIVGEATKVVGIFDVVHSVEMLDTGAQGAFLGTRRRLMSLNGKTAGTLSKMMSGLKSGFTSLLSLSKAVTSMASMNMAAGMDFGMLIASQDPTVQFAGAAVSAPAIAWAQFTYQTALPIVVDVLGSLKGGQTNVLAPIWLHVHEAVDKFENIVQARSRRACTGLRVMLGYSSSFGKALYYNCLATQEMVGGIMSLLLTLIVDLPLYRCLCILPAGDNYVEYVQANCMQMVPPTRKAFWQSTMYIVTSQTSQTMLDICSKYENDIQTEIMQSMDKWKRQAVMSAESIGSLLDEVFVPEAHAGTCQNTLSNPSTLVLTPLPLTHYQVCSKTDTCKERCADANKLLEVEVQALLGINADPHMKATEYSVPVESPFFNRYATSPYVGNAAAHTTDTVVAIRSLAVTANQTVQGCRLSCVQTCMAVALQNDDTIRIEFFCMPNPSMILSTVYSTQLDGATLPSVQAAILHGGEGILRGIDFSLQNSHVYVLLYVLRRSEVVQLQGKAERWESHEVHAYKIAGGEAVGGRILRSEDMASKALVDRNVQNILFNGGEAVNPTVSNCRIRSITEVAPTVEGSMVFFLAISIDIRTWVRQAEEGEWQETSHTLYATFEWYDPEVHPSKQDRWAFYPPCGTACSTWDCGKTCQPKVQAVVDMAEAGSLVHMDGKRYLFLPVVGAIIDGKGARATEPLRVLSIDTVAGTTMMETELTTKFATSEDNNNLVGTWTRASIFGTIATTRTIRSPSTHTAGKGTFPLFFQAKGKITSQWLEEMRYKNSNAGMKLVPYTSQNTSQKAVVSFKCTPLSCGGCATSKLRLLCHQAQNCALVKCVGSLVQTRNVLCGVGGLIEKTYLQAITTWHAMFLIGAELGMLVGKGAMGQTLRVISLKFPTEQFYSLLCACKDMLASVVSVAMSMGEMMTDLLAGKGLDLTGKQDVGMLSGERFLKTSSMGLFMFNCITGVTLLPLMAVHRWCMCMANSSLVGMDEIQVSIQFGDVNMDTSWMQCAHISSVFDLLHNNNVEMELGSIIGMFVDFVVTLVLGIGETVLFGLELLWDSTVDFLIGMVFSIQDLLYTFNLRACKVPNYAQRYVLWCSCEDEAYVIPRTHRVHGIKEGALWCVGSLSITMLDGSTGTVYNPYTMQELSEGVSGVTGYINCLSENADASACPVPSAEEFKLPALLEQSVEPVAVWARCKSNYVHSVWDVGAGTLFVEGNTMTSSLTETLQETAMAWARSVGEDFLQCMQDPGRLQVDFTVCMRMFLSRSPEWQSGPGAYFLYEKAPTDLTEPPDACLVFSGLSKAAPPNSPLQELMTNCSGEGVCDLIPSVWSGLQPQKIPVAQLHGQIPPPHMETATIAAKLYAPIVKAFKGAAEKLKADFAYQAQFMDVALFSADGDFIHDFFDCMYLGPYTRVNLLACDEENLLQCPFYARDNASGASRAFTPCFGAAMDGDHRLPFTCGSQARRSVIKYFFRNFSRATAAGGDHSLSLNVSTKIYAQAMALIENYTNPGSWGCWDPVHRNCNVEACNLQGGYGACLSGEYHIPSEEVGDLIIQTVLGTLREYYALTMHDTAPWTAYYRYGGAQPLPAQWKEEPFAASVAEQVGLWHPHTPLATYDAEEVYSMPTHDQPQERRILGSLWGLCTSLLGQTAMTLPLRRRKAHDNESWAPAGFSLRTGRDNMANLEHVQAMVRNITQDMAMRHCPFAWHRAKRHAPSPSTVCAREKRSGGPHAQERLMVGDVVVDYQTAGERGIRERVGEGLSFPLFGMLQGFIGDANQTCVCAFNDAVLDRRCVVLPETCASFANSTHLPACGIMVEACEAGGYARDLVPDVLTCLRQTSGVRCPELGPSDTWGLFPVDCTHSECAVAGQWAGTGVNSVPVEATRFLNEGRAGLRLPNFRHVNSTFHQSMHYGAQNGSLSAIDMRQPQCFNADQLSPDDNEETTLLLDQTLARLFPAAQAVFDSPATATCSRFVVETVRAEVMRLVSEKQGMQAEMQAAMWKRKCAAKMQQLAACKTQGVFYEVDPPTNWRELAPCGGISLDVTQAYMTPSCIVVDREQRRMYDGHRCRFLQNSNALTRSSLVPACELVPQPLELVQGDTAWGMVRWPEQDPIAANGMPELIRGFDFASVVNLDQEQAGREHISHVLDWWPDEVDAPPGYHPTAASDTEELAPILFDTHYVYDRERGEAYYVHSAARNGSLLFEKAGAAGICRSANVAMPLFDTNTNRICTRMPLKAATDTPTVPVQREEAASPFTMGAVTDTAYADAHFEPERCAESALEVPWTADADDFQSRSAGGILGWQHYTSMDEDGATAYQMDQTAFPPINYRLPDMPAFKEGWSEECAGVRWAEGIPCDVNEEGTCPWGITTCLPLTSPNGTCFSTTAYTRAVQGGTVRLPCFRTTHCPDGMVCLADGGCSPLHLHVWNADSQTEMETTILSDACGWPNKAHPFTQSMRGASPWEQVRDVLPMHGLCGHRYWFAYRHVARTGVHGCQAAQSEDASFMRCNQTETEWPWVVQRPDLQPAEQPQTLRAAGTLLASAHACDAAFMHLQNPWNTTQRLRVCSGFEGASSNTVSSSVPYLQYTLEHSTKTWKGASMQGANSVQAAHWLRTYQEETDEVEVGMIMTERRHTDSPLGFLGGDEAATGVMGEMATTGRVEFFRCTDRLACNNPPHTYNGMEEKQRLIVQVDGQIRNMSEVWLRRCGAIGYLVSDTQCALDTLSFPVLAEILWGESACTHLWSRSSLVGPTGWVVMLGASNITNANVNTNPSKLFCKAAACFYAPRSTAQLSQTNEDDGIQSITARLNSLLQTTAQVVVEATNTATRVYESINQCAAAIMQRMVDGQAALQQAYGSMGPSGVYVAFRLSLHEIPLAWIHHGMLITLLHKVDGTLVAEPNMHLLGISGTVRMDLWEDKATRCAVSAEGKPLLWRMVCENAHPAHTFAFLQQEPLADHIAYAIENAARQAIANEMLTKTGQIEIFCMRKASWKCQSPYNPYEEFELCRQALETAYSPDCMQQVIHSHWLQTCEHPELFILENREKVPLSEILQSSNVLESEVTTFFAQAKNALMEFVDKLVQQVDYVVEGDTKATLLRLQILDADAFVQQATSRFNLTAWLQGPVCHTGFEATDICRDQSAIDVTRDACLFPGAGNPNDMNRYTMTQEEDSAFFDAARGTSQPWVVIRYKETDEQGNPMEDRIPLCSLQFTEQCVPQHFTDKEGAHLNSEERQGTQRQVVSCDIDSIHAPPGVEIQAFALDASIEEWSTMLAAYDQQQGADVSKWCMESLSVHSCIWRAGEAAWEDPNTAAWGFNEDNRFKPYTANFYEIDERWQHDAAASLWNSKGCGLNFNGFCSLRIRLENNAPYNRTVCAEAQNGPNCNSLMNAESASGFRVCGERYEDAVGMKRSLFRCSDCTRFNPVIRESNGLFDCYTSRDGGATPEKEMSAQSIVQTLGFLMEGDKLRARIDQTLVAQDTSTHSIASVTEGGLAYQADLIANANPTITQSLQRWNQRSETAVDSCHTDPSRCWLGYDATATAEFDRIIWNKAIQNPTATATMICNEQQYTQSNRLQCNAHSDQRRQELRAFVQSRYRRANGVWMPRVPQGKGLAWRANVAHSEVRMFSIMHAATNRKEEDRPVSWALGSAVCSDKRTALQDRICVKGLASGEAFEPMHPWLGGDFNPFEGLDECPSKDNTRISLCPCECSPARVCNRYNASVLLQEFPDRSECKRQAFAQVRTMSPDDTTHLCRPIRIPENARCTHAQGLLGGAPSTSVGTDTLHSKQGVPTTPADFVIQSLLADQNGLWYGQTLAQQRERAEKFAFLHMPRDDLHPAHVAFGLDEQTTASPMVVKAVALLGYEDGAWNGPLNAMWIKTMAAERRREREWIARLYPQIAGAGGRRQHWSCPLRAFGFWGGVSRQFAPITPDPIITSVLFPGGAGTHPFIAAASLREALVQYETSNGACFYEKTAEDDEGDGQNFYPNRAKIDVADRANQCGLHGMVRNLILGYPVLSKVVDAFEQRCRTHLDAPNVNARLRSGETMVVDPERAKCGVLHRLSPFLMRTRGDAGTITRVQGLTTRSEGGDCHMGRAFVYAQRTHLVGRQCALFAKNQTHGVSHCPQTGRSSAPLPSVIVLPRASPLSLRQVTALKAKRQYRSEMRTPIVRFMGPGGGELTTPEVSFGTLYSASLQRVLADDLQYACEEAPACKVDPESWTGAAFTAKYCRFPAKLLQGATASARERDASERAGQDRQAAHERLTIQDKALWTTPNWTWSFEAGSGNQTRSRGTVDKDTWLRDRYGACNASYHAHAKGQGQPMIKSITLCEPASTESMQTFCNAMTQFRLDMSLVNCQVMGKGRDCLYQPGMFYLPYAWSTTNQEFAADTVLEFYREIITQRRFEKQQYQLNTLCPARNALYEKIREMSLHQQDACPGHQIEYLKDVLKTFKRLGHDLLYMGFCVVMGAVNLLGMVFAETGAAAASMLQLAMHYVTEFITTGISIIMPLMNMFINILFGATGAGKVIQNIFQVLCEIFNFVVSDLLKPIWCAVVRPVLGGIMKAISFFIRIGGDSTASRNMDTMMSAILGGDSNDVGACLGALNIRIPCSMVMDKEPNGSEFPNQPIATRCWVDSTSSYYTAGGGVLQGSTTNSFLACTMSDTCALDPLRFDSYDSKEDLVPCVQCPPVDLADGGQAFGCNTYLKRCTCGVRSQAPGQCLRNSDCARPSVVCSVTSNMDFARDTSTAMPCAECPGLGAESVCVMDGAASTGVCACMDVRTQNTLHECSHIGETVQLLSDGWCLCMTGSDQYGATTLVFSELSVAPCARGGSNLCMRISLPILASAGGRQTKGLVVLTDTLSSLFLIKAGRRLLFAEPDVAQEHGRWCEAWHANQSNDQVRECVFWRMVGAQLSSGMGLKEEDSTFLVSNQHMLRFAWRHPRAFVQMVQENPHVTRELLGGRAFAAILDVAGQLLGSIRWPNQTVAAGRRLLLEEEVEDTFSSFYTDETPAVTIGQCVALEIPLNKIIGAFWNTIKFYENMSVYLAPGGWNASNQTGAPCANETQNATTCDAEPTLKLPPPSGKPKADYLTMIADLALVIPTGGVRGSHAMDTFLSPMSYEEAVNQNYFTGRRFIKEISFCNYTTLTFGPPSMRPLLPLILTLTVFFLLFITLFSPNMMMTWALWVFVFPVILFWFAYNLSPLCWPMIPPRLPHDVATEIKTLIPDSFDIPDFLVRTNCTARGRSTVDGSPKGECFKTCASHPFYIVSWQDATAWWLCEINVGVCRQFASMTRRWSFMQDMTSSLQYFADVLEFASQDADFVRAHRICAIFSSYHIVFAMLVVAFIVVILPSACLAAAEIVSAALQLILEANGAENT